jgi:hypothetical protein
MYPRCVIGPALTDIVIEVEQLFQESYPWSNVRDILKCFSSNLKSFTIKTIADRPEDPPMDLDMPIPIIELYCSFVYLEKLDARSIKLNSDTLSHFSRLPNLRMIVASIAVIELNEFLSTNISDSEFPSLRVLKLETTHLDACSRLLMRQGFRQLESLTIVRRHGGEFWNLASFFQSLKDHHSHSRLELLNLQSFDIDWYLPNANANAKVSDVTLDALEPLFAFENIIEFHINLDGRVDLDNTSLKCISQAWPNLRVLELNERTMETVPTITLAGLLSFTATCPKLESLTIRVNALHFADAGEIVPSRSIRFLDACTSPLADANGVLSFLIVAFPNLAQLYYGWFLYPPLDETYATTQNERRYAELWHQVVKGIYPITKGKR